METWLLMPNGKAKHPSGKLKEIEDIQDQIDDGRIQLKNYIGSEESNNAIAKKKENLERDWRDSELRETDLMMLQALAGESGRDKAKLIQYRKALRDYPDNSGFPNGKRPTL